MTERNPICLSLAGGIFALWCAYFGIAMIMYGIHTNGAGGDVGGYNLKGIGYFLAIASMSGILGFSLSVASLVRGERLRDLAFWAACLYFLPGLAGLYFLCIFGFNLIRNP